MESGSLSKKYILPEGWDEHTIQYGLQEAKRASQGKIHESALLPEGWDDQKAQYASNLDFEHKMVNEICKLNPSLESILKSGSNLPSDKKAQLMWDLIYGICSRFQEIDIQYYVNKRYIWPQAIPHEDFLKNLEDVSSDALDAKWDELITEGYQPNGLIWFPRTIDLKRTFIAAMQQQKSWDEKFGAKIAEGNIGEALLPSQINYGQPSFENLKKIMHAKGIEFNRSRYVDLLRQEGKLTQKPLKYLRKKYMF